MSAFGADTAGGAVLTAGDCILTVGGSDVYAIQASLQFGRQASPVATIGKGIHFALSNPMGSLQANTLLGLNANAFDSFKAKTKCDRFPVMLTYTPSCKGGGLASSSAVTVSAADCICTAITIAAQGDLGYMSGQFQASFTKMGFEK